MPPSALHDESRLRALRCTGLLDTPPEEAFDRLTRLAARVLGTPLALVSLVDRERLFLKSSVGLGEPAAGRRVLPVEHSFCQHLLDAPGPLVVPDAREHPLFAGTAAAREHGAVAYLGQPLTSGGQVVGALCVLDARPRAWTEDEIAVLRDLAALATDAVALRVEAAALRESEERYRQLFQGAQEGIFLVERDAEGTLRYASVNPRVAAITGIPTERWVGARVADVLPPESAARMEALYARVLETGEGCEVEHATALAHGTIYHRSRYCPLPGADGRVTRLLGITEYVTERRRAEERLRESEERYRQIFEESKDGIFVTARDGTVLDANPALRELYGYRPDEPLIHNAVWHYVDPADRERFRRAIETAGFVRDHEVRIRRKDGTVLDVLHTASVRRAADGTVLGYLGLVHDVTERRRAEAALHEALERYDLVQRATNDTIWDLDLQTGTLRWNEGIGRTFGYAPEEVRGDLTWWAERMHPEDGARVNASFGEALEAQQETWQGEYRFRRADGSYAVVLDRAIIRRDPGGAAVRVIGSLLDVTARRRAEEALRRSEAKFRSLIENASDLISILGAEGAIEYESPAVGRLLGYRPDELEGRSFAEQVHPDDLARIGAQFQRVLERPGVPEPFEVRFRHRDGSYRWLEGIATNLLSDPAVGGIVCNSRDVTEQAAAREALRASSELQRALIDASPLPILVVDREGRVEVWNRAAERTFGWSAREVLGGPAPFLQPAQDEEHRALRRRALAEGGFTAVEVQRRRKDGAPLHISLSVAPLFGPDGSPRSLVSVHEDVTERVQAAEQLAAYARELERSNRELQDFAYVASHDLQEPLRKIQAFGDRLRARFAEPLGPQGDDYLQRMQDAARRMQQLIQDLLAFSRVSSKAAPFVPVDLGQLLHEVLSDLEGRLQATGGEVRAGELPLVEADPLQLRQLLQNVLGNALKYHRPGVPPLVEISARALPRAERTGAEWVELCVRDNGIGFEQQYAERIFAPFQRLHSRGEYEGTGMGLAICRKIVERHGGSITAESSPGAGATFLLTLPRKQRQTGEFA